MDYFKLYKKKSELHSLKILFLFLQNTFISLIKILKVKLNYNLITELSPPYPHHIPSIESILEKYVNHKKVFAINTASMKFHVFLLFIRGKTASYKMMGNKIRNNAAFPYIMFLMQIIVFGGDYPVYQCE